MDKEKYLDSFMRELEKGNFNLFLAIKSYPALNDYNVDTLLLIGDFISQKISEMTPEEFMRLFPIAKVYDGDKCGCKDYFSTIRKINELGLHKKIENVTDFLWDYTNNDIADFLSDYLCAIGRIYREQTGREMAFDGLEHSRIPYTATSRDGMSMISFDGDSTRVTMPNIPYLLQIIDYYEE